MNYTYLQNKRMRRCGVAPPPKCSYSKSLKFFRTSENGLNSAYFAKIAHKIAKPKYFPNIFDDSDSPINSLSDDIYSLLG